MTGQQENKPGKFIEAARQLLESCRAGQVAWGYRRESEPAVEATFLAAMAMLATTPDDPMIERGAMQPAGDWVAGLQQSNGSVGVSPSLNAPRWPTALAILLWSALKAHTIRRASAIEWLLGVKGETFKSVPSDPVQHDTMIPGWPWVANTHSWLEPTAFAVLALRSQNKNDSPRFDDGIGLIVDRSIPTGGWNYGNRVVFETNLRPQVGPTGLALLALAGLETPPPACVAPAISYLEQEVPNLRAPQSLCWGLIGLTAWNRRPAKAREWVEQSFESLLAPKPNRPLRHDAATLLAYLMLGWSETTVELFGVQREKVGKSK